jgi:hypothetical protein
MSKITFKKIPTVKAQLKKKKEIRIYTSRLYDYCLLQHIIVTVLCYDFTISIIYIQPHVYKFTKIYKRTF